MPSMLSAAVLSVTKLEDALYFHRDNLGFTPSAEFTLRGDAFARHWAVPPAMTARATLLSNGASSVGRLLLMEFQAPDR